MEPTFPLFRLPENAIVHALQNLNLNQLFIISLISSKTKRLVTSCGLKATDVVICISRSIKSIVFLERNHLALDFYKDSNDQNGLLPVDITLPVAAYVGYKGPRIQSSTPFNFRNWLNHIKTVFSWTNPPNVSFGHGWERFEIVSLKDTIGSVEKLVPTRQLTDDSSKRVLEHFNTPNRLSLANNPFEEACQIQQIFIQNCELIEFDDVFSLDDMLLINIERAELYHPISQKEFNRFLKHWIRGSNPRLQHMSLLIDTTDFVNGEVYLKGIRCMEMSEDSKIENSQKHNLLVNFDMIQIRRNDGTPAVIATAESEDTLDIHFIVLH